MACSRLAPSLCLADGSGGEAEGVDGFGCCLLHAIRGLLARGYGAACVLNADSPTLPTAHFWFRRPARCSIPGSRAVLGPAEDGGYWLLGMQKRRGTNYSPASPGARTPSQQRHRGGRRRSGCRLHELGLVVRCRRPAQPGTAGARPRHAAAPGWAGPALSRTRHSGPVRSGIRVWPTACGQRYPFA